MMSNHSVSGSSLVGANVTFQAFNPGNNPISEMVTVQVSANDVELPQINDLDQTGTRTFLVNVDIDINSDSIEIDFDNAGTGQFASSTFNGYKFAFPDSLTSALDDIKLSENSLNLTDEDVFKQNNALFVNVEGRSFTRNDQITVQLKSAENEFGLEPNEALVVDDNRKLSRVDLTTATASVITETNRVYTDVAVSRNGDIFAATFNDLFRINPTTFEETKVSDFSTSVNALTFDGSNNLYAADLSGNIFQVDPTTGDRMSVAQTSASEGDLVFADGNLFLAASDNGGSRLIKINPSTGATDSVETVNFDQVFGLTLTASGEIIGFDSDDFFRYDVDDSGFVSRQIAGLDGGKVQGAAPGFRGVDTPGLTLPTANVEASQTTVSEGEAVTFTVTAENVPPGFSLAYTISGVSASDVGSLNGAIDVNADGSGSVTIQTKDDELTEGDETLLLALDDFDAQAQTTLRDNAGESAEELAFFDLPAVDQVAAVYVGYFGRAPDRDGRDFWVTDLTQDLSQGQSPAATAEEMARGFRFSEEAQSLFPFLNPSVSTDATESQIERFLNDVFDNLFNRDLGPAGTEFWVGEIDGRLESGQNIGDVIVDVMAGAGGVDVTTLQNKIKVAKAYTDNVTTFEAEESIQLIGAIDKSEESVEQALGQIG